FAPRCEGYPSAGSMVECDREWQAKTGRRDPAQHRPPVRSTAIDSRFTSGGSVVASRSWTTVSIGYSTRLISTWPYCQTAYETPGSPSRGWPTLPGLTTSFDPIGSTNGICVWPTQITSASTLRVSSVHSTVSLPAHSSSGSRGVAWVSRNRQLPTV